MNDSKKLKKKTLTKTIAILCALISLGTALIIGNGGTNAMRSVANEARSIYNEQVDANLLGVADAEKEQMKADFSQSMTDAINSASVTTGILFVVVIVLAVLLAWSFSKRLVKPLKELQRFAGDMSAYDFTTNVEIKEMNEIGQTAQALQNTQSNVRALLKEITYVSDEINKSLHSFNESFAQMKEAISQVSAAVESITENIVTQAGATESADNNIKDIADVIAKTSEETGTLDNNTKSMNSINEQTENSVKNLVDANDALQAGISKMSVQTDATNKAVLQISETANLIKDIATQTNLLSLNASIEAARAGESGRGFSVVASEIGKLANQSAESVSIINEAVASLQKNSDKSLEIMNNMNQASAEQVSSLDEVKENFVQLGKELEQCVSSVQTIALMTNQLEKQKNNVMRSIESLSQTAQDNAASSQETAAMSDELSRSVNEASDTADHLSAGVERLLKNVGRFKV